MESASRDASADFDQAAAVGPGTESIYPYRHQHRQQEMRHYLPRRSASKEFGLYVPRTRVRAPPPKPIRVAVSEVVSDKPPQLPPLTISPLSPRWDVGTAVGNSTASTNSLVSHQSFSSVFRNTDATASTTTLATNTGSSFTTDPPSSTTRSYFTCSPPIPSTPLTDQHPFYPSARSPTTPATAPYRYHARSAAPPSVRVRSSLSIESRHDPQTPQSPTRQPHPLAPGAEAGADAVAVAAARQIENCSRPRKPSNKRFDASYGFLRPGKTRSSADLQPETMSLHAAGMRSRGPSVSSVNTTSTFASAPLPRSVAAPPEFGDVSPGAAVGLGLSRSHFENQSREVPWLAGDGGGGTEVRSSFRSHMTAESNCPDTTSATERTSVATGDSSVASLVLDPPASDEPSVEDVMCLYETGFNDTEPSDPGDFDDRPETARSAPNRASKIMFDPNDIPSMPSLPALAAADPASFRSLDPPPHGMSRAGTPSADADDEDDGDVDDVRRDSGKSLPSALSGVSDKMSRIREGAAELVSEHPNVRDRYGFRKENQYITQEQYDRWNLSYTEYLARRRRKWVAYLKENSLMTDRPNRFPPKNNKTKRFVRKGIPPDWRGAAWFYYAGGPALLARNPGLYDRLLTQEAKAIDVEAVERDLHRTFPDNVRFKPPVNTNAPRSPRSPPPPPPPPSSPPPDGDLASSDPPPDAEDKEEPIITSLRRVLLAFSIHNPKIGYCQSLNFLAGLLLLFVESEEHCFWLLNVITLDFLPGTHELSLEGSKVDLGVLMTSLYESMPAVWAKIAGDMDQEPIVRPQTGKSAKKARPRRRDIAPPAARLPPITLCMTAWFMSCFIGTLPIETALRVWDVMFYEGPKTLFRIALAIFKLGESEIEAMMDPMEMFSVVQTIPRRMLDANMLMETCFKRRNGFGHLSQETTEARRKERREQVQQEKSDLATGSGNATEVESGRRGPLFGRRK